MEGLAAPPTDPDGHYGGGNVGMAGCLFCPCLARSGGYDMCHLAERIEVVPFADGLSARVLNLYESRRDKSWGLTDCLSITVMRDRKISAALSTDRDFIQAGFRALLLEEPPT